MFRAGVAVGCVGVPAAEGEEHHGYAQDYGFLHRIYLHDDLLLPAAEPVHDAVEDPSDAGGHLPWLHEQQVRGADHGERVSAVRGHDRQRHHRHHAVRTAADASADSLWREPHPLRCFDDREPVLRLPDAALRQRAVFRHEGGQRQVR